MSKISGIFATAAAAALISSASSAPSFRRRADRRPDHENQHQPVLRQDEAGLRGEGQGARPHAASLRRQVRRRQRRRSRCDRAAYGRRRQGHPAGAERLRPRSCRQSRRPARPASSSSPSTRRSIRRPRPTRNVRHRQLQGRRADRRVGQGDARRQGQDRQDRNTRSRRERTVGRLSCVTTASSPASAFRSRIPSTTP